MKGRLGSLWALEWEKILLKLGMGKSFCFACYSFELLNPWFKHLICWSSFTPFSPFSLPASHGHQKQQLCVIRGCHQTWLGTSWNSMDDFPAKHRSDYLRVFTCSVDSCSVFHGGFHKWGVPQNGWFIMNNPMKMDDLGCPHFTKPPHVITL